MGSAPSYAHGIIDQISEIAAMAKEFNIGCHVDCCLGGFVLPWIQDGSIPPFDFRVDGVTSISADTHKVFFILFIFIIILLSLSIYLID